MKRGAPPQRKTRLRSHRADPAPRPERVRSKLAPIEARADVVAMRPGGGDATPKRAVVASAALRRSARGEPCTVRGPGCDGGGETTVLAHLAAPGLPAASKVTDLSAVFACAVCHRHTDRQAISPAFERERDHLLRLAQARTLTRWLELGLLRVAGHDGEAA